MVIQENIYKTICQIYYFYFSFDFHNYPLIVNSEIMSYSKDYIQNLAERPIGESRNPLWFEERVGSIMSTSALQIIRFSHQIKEYGAWGRPWYEERFENKLNFLFSV